MASASSQPSAEEIFSALETEFTRVTGTTPPPSPTQPRCLYSFRVDVVVERIGRRLRLVSLRPVRNPSSPFYSASRRPSSSAPSSSSYPFSGYHPYDPPLRPQQPRPSAFSSPQQPRPSAFSSPQRPQFPRPSSSTVPPSPCPCCSSSFCQSAFSPRPTAPSAPKATFDRESHRRFMEKLAMLAEAEERWRAQKAREAQSTADSVRGSGGDRISSTPR